jgi:hypothetical protein
MAKRLFLAGVAILSGLEIGSPIPFAAPAPPIPYIFVPCTDEIVAFQWDGWVHVGTLDSQGGFHVRDKLSKIDAAKELGLKKSERLPCGVTAFSFPLKCYELHSGRLTLGTMMPDGKFIPTAGAKLVDFEDYQYDRDPKIWNLPGSFMRRDAFDKRRAWLAEHIKENPGLQFEKAVLDGAVPGKK